MKQSIKSTISKLFTSSNSTLQEALNDSAQSPLVDGEELVDIKQLDARFNVALRLNEYREMVDIIDADTAHFSSRKCHWAGRHGAGLDEFLVRIVKVVHGKYMLSTGLNIRPYPNGLDSFESRYHKKHNYTAKNGFIKGAALIDEAPLSKQLDEYREILETIEEFTGWFSTTKAERTKEIAKRLDDFILHIFILIQGVTPEEANQTRSGGMFRIRNFPESLTQKVRNEEELYLECTTEQECDLDILGGVPELEFVESAVSKAEKKMEKQATEDELLAIMSDGQRVESEDEREERMLDEKVEIKYKANKRKIARKRKEEKEEKSRIEQKEKRRLTKIKIGYGEAIFKMIEKGIFTERDIRDLLVAGESESSLWYLVALEEPEKQQKLKLREGIKAWKERNRQENPQRH